jgi:hypothetical protein
MKRLALIGVAAAVVAAVAAVAWPSEAEAGQSPVPPYQQILYYGSPKFSQNAEYLVDCVSPYSISRATGSKSVWGYWISRDAEGWRNHIYLNRETVCRPLIAWIKGGGKLTTATVLAVHTVQHEVQHAQGVRAEWRAECQAVKPTLRALRATGATAQQVRQARDYLLHEADEYRPAEYDLRGRCAA